MHDQSIELDDTFEEVAETSAESQAFNIGNSKVIPLGHGEMLAFYPRRTNSISVAADDCQCECPGDYEGCVDRHCGFVPDRRFDEATGDCGVFGFTLCCRRCSGTDACLYPIRPMLFYQLAAELSGFNSSSECGIIYTGCVPNVVAGSSEEEDSLFSSIGGTAPESSPFHKYLRKLAAPARKFAHIRVQSVNDPSVFVPIVIPLGSEPAKVTLPSEGWIVHIIPNGLPRSLEPLPLSTHAMVHPSVTPVTHTSLHDEAFSASVSLPEAGGMRQYWITVPDSSLHPQSPLRYAILTTTDWTVILYRSPTKASAPGFKKRKCGCHE